MPSNQKGKRVAAYGGDGNVEMKKKPAEKNGRKKFEKNRKKHKTTARAAFKLRSPRI